MTEYNNLPVLAMRGNFFFPNIRAKVEVAREISRNALKFALENGGRFLMVSQIDGSKPKPTVTTDFFTVGVIAEMVSVESATVDATTVMARTFEAAKITHWSLSENIIFANVETLDYTCKDDNETRALFEQTMHYLGKLAEVNKTIAKLELKSFYANAQVDYLAFTNVIANEIVNRLQERQTILEETDVERRMERICAYIIAEIDFANAEKRIANRVKQQVQSGQKEYYLREQMKAISAELGEDANEKQDYLDRIKASGMPEEVAKRRKRSLTVCLRCHRPLRTRQ